MSSGVARSGSSNASTQPNEATMGRIAIQQIATRTHRATNKGHGSITDTMPCRTYFRATSI
jgi:hypothetical protein